jgi:hypothetical protein
MVFTNSFFRSVVCNNLSFSFYYQPRCVAHSVFGMTMGVYWDCGAETPIAEQYFVCYAYVDTLSDALQQVADTSASAGQYESTASMLVFGTVSSKPLEPSLGRALGMVCKAGIGVGRVLFVCCWRFFVDGGLCFRTVASMSWWLCT